MLERGWREGPESLTPSCWQWQMLQKHPPKGKQLKGFLSPSMFLTSEKLRVKPTISELWNEFPCPVAVCEGHFKHKWVPCQGKIYPMLLQRNSSVVTCMQQEWLEPQPWERPPPHEPVCAICHLSVFPSGAAAWVEQGRGLILLSLQEFNWKGIAFDLISSLVSTQA